jgi:hypothetical protein
VSTIATLFTGYCFCVHVYIIANRAFLVNRFAHEKVVLKSTTFWGKKVLFLCNFYNFFLFTVVSNISGTTIAMPF